MGGFNFIFCVAENFIKTVGFDFIVSNANDFIKNSVVSKLSHRKKYGFVITNPPYGKRLEEEEDMPALYREIGEAFSHLDSWSFYLITAFDQAERYLGRKADKNRKIYNGMMKTYFYQYMGPKPPRRNRESQ